MNLSNGGLITKLNTSLYVCDLERYSGTYVLSEGGEVTGRINSIMWFATPKKEEIYYSNQKDNDYLYCLDTESMTEKCILQRSCSNVTGLGESIYFLDDEAGFICQFDPQTAQSVPKIKEKVFSFILNLDFIYYASETGLKKLNLSSGQRQTLFDGIPCCLNLSQNKLIFADKTNNFTLSSFDLTLNKLNKFEEIKTQSIATDEDYIYVANILDNRSIIRANISTGEIIRFCGEKSDKLHIINDCLYFLNQNDKNTWYKMPLSGGRNMRLIQA